MNAHKFTGSNSRQALQAVKRELGADAIILSNRAIEGGIEITAIPAAMLGLAEGGDARARAASAPAPPSRRRRRRSRRPAGKGRRRRERDRGAAQSARGSSRRPGVGRSQAPRAGAGAAAARPAARRVRPGPGAIRHRKPARRRGEGPGAGYRRRSPATCVAPRRTISSPAAGSTRCSGLPVSARPRRPPSLRRAAWCATGPSAWRCSRPTPTASARTSICASSAGYWACPCTPCPMPRICAPCSRT